MKNLLLLILASVLAVALPVPASGATGGTRETVVDLYASLEGAKPVYGEVF